MTTNKKEMGLRDLLIIKLQALYDVEHALVKALPKMADAATDSDLKDGFRDHLDETRTHVLRLEQIFEMMDLKPKKLKSEAIRGLIDDGEWVIKNVKNDAARDAALVAAAQYVEHYEMAGYGSAKSWAEEIGDDEIAALLEQTLEEERAADEKLSDLAMSKINECANS